jgi:hypothetical protein
MTVCVSTAVVVGLLAGSSSVSQTRYFKPPVTLTPPEVWAFTSASPHT